MRRRVAASAGALLLPLVHAACSTQRMAPWPRAARPMPQEVQQSFAVPDFELVELAPPRQVGNVAIRDGKLHVEDRDLAIKLFLPQPETCPRPFLVVLGPMAGGDKLMNMVSMALAEHGIASGRIERRGGIFKPRAAERNGEVVQVYESASELDDSFRQIVRHQRAFLSWVAELPEIDRDRLGCVGISLGGVLAATLAGVEPRLSAASVCLAGGALPDLMMHTRLGRVKRWMRARSAATKLSLREYERFLTTRLRSDPARLGRYVDPRKVLMVTAQLDSVVPARNSDILWESMGRPTRVLVPLGHYTSMFVFDWILRQVAEHSLQRFR